MGVQSTDAGKKAPLTCSKIQLLKCCASPTWWSLRGGCTRSHSEHGRETPLRQWYFVSRRGRVGRCQVCKTQHPCAHAACGTKIIFSFTKTNGPCRLRQRVAHKATLPALNNRQPETVPKRESPQNHNAGWSSPVARQAHNLKAAGSNPAPATRYKMPAYSGLFCIW